MKLKKLLAKKNQFTEEVNIYINNFKNFRTIRTFGKDIYESKTTLDDANIDQDNLFRDIRNFNYKTRPQLDNKIQEKKCS